MFITGAVQEGFPCLALLPPVNHKIQESKMANAAVAFAALGISLFK